MEKKIFVCQLKDGNIEYALAKDEKEALNISRGEKVIKDYSIADWSRNEKKYQKHYKKYYGKK